MNTLVAALLVSTGPSLQVRVDGEGWMRFMREGRVVYAREANLTIHNGRLGMHQVPLTPTISVPSNVEGLRITDDGTVWGRAQGVEAQLGRLSLGVFAEGTALAPSEGFYTSPLRPIVRSAGSDGAGRLKMIEPRPTMSAAVRPNMASPVPASQPRPATTVVSGMARITVRSLSIIEGNQFTLGELAEVSGAAHAEALKAIVIGDTPPIGIVRKIDRERILVRLRVSGINVESIQLLIPSDAAVKRASQVIEHGRFVDVATNAVRAVVGERAEIKDLSPLPALELPKGDVQLLAGKPSVVGSAASVAVEIWLDGQRRNSRTVRLSVSGNLPLPTVGSTVSVVAVSNGLRVQLTARVVAVRGVSQVEIQTQEGVRLVGTLVQAGVVEVKL